MIFGSKCVLTATNIGQPVICMPDQGREGGREERNRTRRQRFWSSASSSASLLTYPFLPSFLPPSHTQLTWTPWSVFWGRRRSSVS